MKQQKIYECIIDFGDDLIIRTYIPASNKNELLKMYAGNGEFIQIKEYEFSTGGYISLDKINQALTMANFGKMEIDVITRILQNANDEIFK